MTTVQLLAWILGALGLQALAGTDFAVWRRGQAVEQPAGEQRQPLPPGSSGSWQGLRKFRVAQRCVEDVARSYTVANIRSKHEREGIRDFGNCVECRRDPGVEPDQQGRAGASGQRKKKEED